MEQTSRRKSAYQAAADNLIAQLEAGTIPWRKPWKCAGTPRNLLSQKPYRGINVFILAMHNYSSPYWLTLRQANQIGGSIMKGEKATSICFWSTFEKKQMKHNDETGQDEESSSRFGFWKSYSVFNLAQCNPELAESLGLNQPSGPVEDLPAAQAIWDGYADRPELRDANKAFYSPSLDQIGMPPRNAFPEQREYFSTLFHEMAHSTGAAKRLNREGITKPGKSFGDEDYSQEELCSEFSASMLCGAVGIQPSVVANSAAYVKHWLEVLKASDNKKVLMKAISDAQKACDHIRGTQFAEPLTPKVEEQELVAV
jgi:antirestriction protein ArdC